MRGQQTHSPDLLNTTPSHPPEAFHTHALTTWGRDAARLPLLWDHVSCWT